MSQTENNISPVVSVEEIQKTWNQFTLRVEQLETGNAALEHENKALRQLLSQTIEYRKKSHGDLVNLVTTLVSKLPMNDLGPIITKLVEHNNQVAEITAALLGGKLEEGQMQPAILKMLDKTKRELNAAIKPLVDELIKLDSPFEVSLLQMLVAKPQDCYAPPVVRASRCFVKGQVPRERIVREFGEEALVFFKDLTTDVKYNPRPKPEEIILGFVADFEKVLAADTAFPAAKKTALLALHERIKRSREATELARAQKNAFLKLSFVLEMLHYYENQNTESPDAVFAQRLPPLIEQIVITGERDSLDENLLKQAEVLLAYVINHDYRQSVINNIGKSGGLAKTLRLVLSLRAEKAPESDETAVEFVKHFIPLEKVPPVATLVSVLRLTHPNRHRKVIEAILATDRIRKTDAETLGQAVAKELGITDFASTFKKAEALSPEKEQQLAWENIKDLIASRASPNEITVAIRKRLHAKYDGDEVKQSWLVLTASDALLLIRIFCLLPYLPDGQTDPIARAILESYVSRLTHEKYADIYLKVVSALKNLYKVKADSPALVNFISLVRWVDPAAADKLSHDIGIVAAG